MWCGKKNVVPLAVEYVSKTYGLEYDNKKDDYASVGVSYYVVYNPGTVAVTHNPFEVYRLVNGAYVLQSGEPVWIPEIGLGLAEDKVPIEPGRGGCTGMTKAAIGSLHQQKWLSRLKQQLEQAAESQRIARLKSEVSTSTLSKGSCAGHDARCLSHTLLHHLLP